METTFSMFRCVQSILVLVVNLTFLALLIKLKPMVYYPSSYFSGKNLFHIVEVFSCSILVVDGCLALVGSVLHNMAVVNAIGIIFVIVNFSFAVTLIWAYLFDTRKLLANYEAPAAFDDKELAKEISKSVINIWLELVVAVDIIEKTDDEKLKVKLVKELMFTQSKLIDHICTYLADLDVVCNLSKLSPIQLLALDTLEELVAKLEDDIAGKCKIDRTSDAAIRRKTCLSLAEDLNLGNIANVLKTRSSNLENGNNLMKQPMGGMQLIMDLVVCNKVECRIQY